LETYAKLLNIAIPFFVTLIVLEAVVANFQKKQIWNRLDTLASLASGMSNVLKDVLGLSFVIISYDWLVSHFSVFTIKNSFLVYLIAFIGIDFAGYWVHRISHHVNFFWNTHIIHHSSEEFNLACALRQSISNFFSIAVFFLVPIAILGVPSEVIAIIAPLHLFAQYWYHTRLIGKLGLLEKIIVTPSSHRVHHAINPEYLDKNLGQIFIIWDLIFGTYQEELDDVPPIYGVTRQVNTYNPFIINFQHLWLMIKDAYRTNDWSAKIKIWLMPTGWRPEDVVLKYPVQKITNPYSQSKYHMHLSLQLELWVWIEFFFSLVLMLLLFNHIGRISPSMIIWSGIFLFTSIFSFTSLMDKSRMAIPASFLGSIIGFVLVSTSLSFSFYLLVPVALFLIINPIITTTLLPNK
jgi:sterol desaturase/sphingolipid hydroxylase (fatty acid hydroxylase superfamily)